MHLILAPDTITTCQEVFHSHKHDCSWYLVSSDNSNKVSACTLLLVHLKTTVDRIRMSIYLAIMNDRSRNFDLGQQEDRDWQSQVDQMYVHVQYCSRAHEWHLTLLVVLVSCCSSEVHQTALCDKSHRVSLTNGIERPFSLF